MKTLAGYLFIHAVLFLLIVNTVCAQENVTSDSLFLTSSKKNAFPGKEKRERKNSIMLNITNPLLISDKFRVIGYERTFANNQSITLNVGTFSLPQFLGGNNSDSLKINNDTSEKGFHFSTDYRFYLKKLNRFDAPRGVYLAPYYTFNYLKRQNSWNLDGYESEVFTNTSFNIHSLGVELGYQFVFWDRFALDLILIGPGVGFYKIKTEIGTTLSAADEALLFEKINEIIADRIPGYDKLIEPGDYVKKGSANVVSAGYRYIIRVGYRF